MIDENMSHCVRSQLPILIILQDAVYDDLDSAPIPRLTSDVRIPGKHALMFFTGTFQWLSLSLSLRDWLLSKSENRAPH